MSLALDVYVANYPMRPHERKQVNELLREFYRWFSGSSTKCAAIIGMQIPLAQIDLLLLKDNRLVILELKNSSGRIEADCSSDDRLWKAIEANGRATPLGSVNPFFQAKRERISLARFLQQNIITKSEISASGRSEPDHVSSRIIGNTSAWVVGNNDAEFAISGISIGSVPWFRVMRMRDVAMELASEYNSEPLLQPGEFSDFLVKIGAEKREWNRWEGPKSEFFYENGGADSPTQVAAPRVIGIPKLEFLLDSPDDQNVLMALDFVEKLDLLAFSERVREKWSSRNPTVRLKALNLMATWEPESLGGILAEALEDSSPEIVSFAFACLEGRSYPETTKILYGIVEAGPSGYFYQALKAVESNPSDDSRRLVLRLASRVLDGHPFSEFRNLPELLDSTLSARRSRLGDQRELRSRYESESTRFARLMKLSESIISALGNLKCREAVLPLIDIVSSPSSLGMNRTEQVDEPYDRDSYQTIAIYAIRSLAKIQDHRATEALLRRLSKKDEEDKHLIILALGDLGDKKASRALVTFLTSSDETHRRHALIALGQLADESTFDDIARIYVRNLRREEWSFEEEEALLKISKLLFEELLLRLLSGKEESDEFRNRCVRAVGRVATHRSASALFDLLSSDSTYETAADVLSFRLGGDAQVRERAMKLLESGNETLCAAGLVILWGNPRNDALGLGPFAVHPSWKVRKTVCMLYGIRKDVVNILGFARDQDQRVRSEALTYLGFTEIRGFGACTVASRTSQVRGWTYLAPGVLVTELKDDALLLETGRIARIGLHVEKGDDLGVFLRYQQADKVSDMLIAPESKPGRDLRYWSNEILLYLQKAVGRYTGESELTTGEQGSAGELWRIILDYRSSHEKDNDADL